MREISQHSLRIRKVLKDANIKLGSVLSDVLGVSGRAMLTAAYFMLRNGVAYRDRGPTHFEQRQRDSPIRRLIRRLNDLARRFTSQIQIA